MPWGAMEGKRRRADDGATVSESESSAAASLGWARRAERGEGILAGDVGDEGGERAKWVVRAMGFERELVGVTSRVVRLRMGEIASAGAGTGTG